MNQIFNNNCEACVHNQSVNNNLQRLARLEQLVDELGSANEYRLTDLEEALQVAYNRINKLEDYITGIEEAEDTVSECSICCQCTRCEQEGGYEYYKADSGVEYEEEDDEDEEEEEEEEEEEDGVEGLAELAAEPLDEFARNDDFVPLSYYDDEDAEENIYVDVNNWETETEDYQVVPEMITVQFAGQDELVQFPSASYCEQVSSIPEDGHLEQAMPMCMYPQDMHEQDMRLNYDTCYPVLCAEEEEEQEEKFPWNSELLENGDLLYGTCSDEYEKYYAERMASIHAPPEEEQANDCAAFYQFKALDVDRTNGLDERIAQVLGQDEEQAPANEDDDKYYYNEEYINHNYSCHCNY